MTKLEQHLLEINKHLNAGFSTPADLLQYIKDRCINTLQKTDHLEDDCDEGEFFWYLTELDGIINAIPLSLTFGKDHKAMISQLICEMPWDNFMTEEGAKKRWNDETKESDFMTLGSMFYNKLTWISEGSENEYLTDFADEFGDDLLIDFLNELEEICK